MGVCGRDQPLGGRRKLPQSTSASPIAREGRSCGTTNAGLRSHGGAIVDSRGSWGCISGHGSSKPWPLAFGSSPSESRSRFWDTASPVRGYRSRLQLNPEPSGCSSIPSFFSITISLPSPSLAYENCGQRRACVVVVKLAVIGGHGGSQVLWEVAALGFAGLA
ncbi:hypothetical protein CDL15_Pgr028998 [Punica granatum]|uniref:Uncharacterized protein n=1 Tax=Punica granatum TaxID=22663 RepID=A0A218XK37_PUNGR|nr:hypothetical protein CDL15_Pgr028998 [Punica granatum]